MKTQPKVLDRARSLAVQARAGRCAPPMMAVESGAAQLYLYAPIGRALFGDGISATDVVAALASVKGKATALDVHIACEGGDVWQGKAIYQAIKTCGMKTTAYVDSLAASAASFIASFIACACDRVVSARQATWMVHRSWSLAVGNADELRGVADMMDVEDRAIASIYAAKTGRSEAECMELMAAETWLSAADATALGLSDEVMDDEDGPEDRSGRGDEEDDDQEEDDNENERNTRNRAARAQAQRLAAEMGRKLNPKTGQLGR
jgi:ATP-dependent protease ClpP protease subunit